MIRGCALALALALALAKVKVPFFKKKLKYIIKVILCNITNRLTLNTENRVNRQA